MAPVFSRREPVIVDVEGRRYTVAALTWLQRVAFRAELTTASGVYPSQDQLAAALRAALTDLAPGNLAELLPIIDAATDGDTDPAMLSQLAAIEAACSGHPVYAPLLAARQRYLGLLPYIAAKHALRGWEGEGLPPFARVRGVVPDELIEVLPQADVDAVGWAAHGAMMPSAAAEKNSEAPSLSHESLAPSAAD